MVTQHVCSCDPKQCGSFVSDSTKVVLAHASWRFVLYITQAGKCKLNPCTFHIPWRYLTNLATKKHDLYFSGSVISSEAFRQGFAKVETVEQVNEGNLNCGAYRLTSRGVMDVAEF
jgi:hypothetical protein